MPAGASRAPDPVSVLPRRGRPMPGLAVKLFFLAIPQTPPDTAPLREPIACGTRWPRPPRHLGLFAFPVAALLQQFLLGSVLSSEQDNTIRSREPPAECTARKGFSEILQMTGRATFARSTGCECES